MGVYGQRIGYDVARDVAFSGSGSFQSKINPRQLGIPDDFRVDYLELDFHGGSITTTSASTVDVDSVAEFGDFLAALVSSITIESSAMGQVINALSLEDVWLAGIGAFGVVDLDTDLPLPGQSKATTASNTYSFDLKLRVPFFAPGPLASSNGFQIHQFPNGGISATWGAGTVSLGGVSWTIGTGVLGNIRLVGRRVPKMVHSPLRYNLVSTGATQTGIEFEQGRYLFLGKRDESLATVLSSGAGGIDLFVDQTQVYAKSEYDPRQVESEWLHTRGPGRADVYRLLDSEGSGIGAVENVELIPVLFYDPSNANPNRIPMCNSKITLNLDTASYSTAGTWLTVSARPTREVGKGAGGCCPVSGAAPMDNPANAASMDADQAQFQPLPATN
jgi:hypothetical protein